VKDQGHGVYAGVHNLWRAQYQLGNRIASNRTNSRTSQLTENSLLSPTLSLLPGSWLGRRSTRCGRKSDQKILLQPTLREACWNEYTYHKPRFALAAVDHYRAPADIDLLVKEENGNQDGEDFEIATKAAQLLPTMAEKERTIVEEGLAIQDFLERNSTQLTYHGIVLLHQGDDVAFIKSMQ